MIPTVTLWETTARFIRDRQLVPEAGLDPWDPIQDYNGLLERSTAEQARWRTWGEMGAVTSREMVARFHRAGIRLGVGTDVEEVPWAVHLELEELVRSGLEPLEAIHAATAISAEILGAEGELGTIEEGKWADLVILDADPLADIRNTRQIHAVIKGGEVVDRAAIRELARPPGS